jgi:hypothetical protein
VEAQQQQEEEEDGLCGRAWVVMGGRRFAHLCKGQNWRSCHPELCRGTLSLSSTWTGSDAQSRLLRSLDHFLVRRSHSCRCFIRTCTSSRQYGASARALHSSVAVRWSSSSSQLRVWCLWRAVRFHVLHCRAALFNEPHCREAAGTRSPLLFHPSLLW